MGACFVDSRNRAEHSTDRVDCLPQERQGRLHGTPRIGNLGRGGGRICSLARVVSAETSAIHISAQNSVYPLRQEQLSPVIRDAQDILAAADLQVTPGSNACPV